MVISTACDFYWHSMEDVVEEIILTSEAHTTNAHTSEAASTAIDSIKVGPREHIMILS